MKDATPLLKKALIFGGVAILIIAVFWVVIASR